VSRTHSVTTVRHHDTNWDIGWPPINIRGDRLRYVPASPPRILRGLDRPTEPGHMKLTQGLMSAISAGMLIYSACVEMLAGDFIMDSLLWKSGVWKQGVALVSLFGGVGAMALVD